MSTFNCLALLYKHFSIINLFIFHKKQRKYFLLITPCIRQGNRGKKNLSISPKFTQAASAMFANSDTLDSRDSILKVVQYCSTVQCHAMARNICRNYLVVQVDQSSYREYKKITKIRASSILKVTLKLNKKCTES